MCWGVGWCPAGREPAGLPAVGWVGLLGLLLVMLWPRPSRQRELPTTPVPDVLLGSRMLSVARCSRPTPGLWCDARAHWGRRVRSRALPHTLYPLLVAWMLYQGLWLQPTTPTNCASCQPLTCYLKCFL
ncbi:MAG: hypothetical protein WKG07_15280 [Hymenobacter sp.]